MNVRNIVVISDTHFGCRFGLCPPKIQLDGDILVVHSHLQSEVWKGWKIFWEEFVPKVTKGEEFIIVHNGDVLDGEHHRNKTHLTENTADQLKIAEQTLKPVIDNPKCTGYFQIRGTETHTGKSGENEELLAKMLGATPNETGEYSRYEMWLRFAGGLCHFSHHVGVTSSASYESTAVYKELVEAYNESGRWGKEPPDVVVRSHRHRAFKIDIPSGKGSAYAVVTPGWQLKTPFVYRQALGRSSTPHFGGSIIRNGDEVPLYVRSKYWSVERPNEVVI